MFYCKKYLRKLYILTLLVTITSSILVTQFKTPNKIYALDSDGIATLAATQTTAGTDLNSTSAALEFSTSAFDTTYFTHDQDGSEPERLYIETDGDYFVGLALPLNSTAVRPVIRSEVYVNGTEYDGALSESSYIRNSNGHTESSNSLGYLIEDLVDGDYIEVFVEGTAGTGSTTVTGQASLYVEYIDDTNRTAFTATATQTTAPSTPTNYNQTTAYELEWAEGRKDSGITHSDVTDPEDIQLDAIGHYLVFVNVPLQGTVIRGNILANILLDGSTVTGGIASQGYIRNNNSHDSSSLHWAGIVTTTSTNQLLSVSLEREGNAGTITTTTNKEASIYIEYLPNTNEKFFATATQVLTDADNWNPATKTAIEWENAGFSDTAAFTHSTTANEHQVQVEYPGDYLLVYNDALVGGLSRANIRATVEVNGSEVTGAQSKSHYLRSATNNNSSNSLVFFLEDLSAGDEITVSVQQEANSGTANDAEDGLLFLWFKGNVVPKTTQLHYRWRDNSKNLDKDGGWLESEDTGIIDSTIGTTYRVRMSVANTGIDIEAAARTYELQWGELSTTCADVSVWTGVANSSDEIDMSATPRINPDGEVTADEFMANDESYTRVDGEGRDVADTTGSLGPLDIDEYIELEYSIEPTASTTKGKTYCFRLYDTTGATVLDEYDVYPTLKMESIDIDQAHFRWRDDTTALNTSGGWLAAEDSNAIGEGGRGDNYRLRFELANIGTSPQATSKSYEIQWGLQETTCSAIIYWTGMADVSDAFDMVDSTNISPDGQSLTPGLLTNSEGYTFVSGEGRDVADTTGLITALTSDDYTEIEGSFTATTNTIGGATYCFRIYNVTDDIPLEFYSEYPTLTMELGGLKTQKIIGSISGATSATETIPEALASVNNAFLLFDFSGASNADNTPQEATCSAHISSTTQVTVEKSSAAGTCNYAIYVIEALHNEFTVRGRGGITLGTTELSDTGSANNISNIIDPNKVVVYGMARSNGNGTNEWRSTHSSLTLTDTSTVTAQRGALGSSVTAVNRYEVVEWLDSGVTIQSAEADLSTLNNSGVTITLDKSIDLDRSFVYATFRHVDDGLTQTSIRSWLSDVTTLNFDRNNATAYESYARWYVIEFPSGTNVQRGIGTESAAATVDVSLESDVILSRSFPIFYASNSGAGNAFPRGKYYSNLDAVNSLTATVGYEGNNVNYSWQVIDTAYWFASDYNYVQNDFEWFVPQTSVTLTNNWPENTSTPDLAENEVITTLPAGYEPLNNEDTTRVRLQMNLTTTDDTLAASTDAYKLQYAQANDCTATFAWNDVGAIGSGVIWRLYDEATITSPTTQVNQISTSDSSAEGYYSEASPTSTNPNEVLANENSEWDWPLENNGAAPNTTYCFRMVLSNDDNLGSYRADSFPKLETAPGSADLMRHGNFFSNEVEKGFFWTD